MRLDQVTIAPVFAPWLILLLLLLGLAAVLLQFWLLRKRLGSRKAFALSFLRSLALLCLIAFALNPFMVRERGHQLRPTLGLLLGTSHSMGLSGQRGATRLDDARAILQTGSTGLLQSLGERFDVQIYGMGESLKTLKPDDVAGLRAEGREGDLNEALNAVAEQTAVAVVLSDGNLKWDETRSPPLPVLTIPVGNREQYKDILIKGVKFPNLAFRSRRSAVDVTIKAYGYAGLDLPVLLREGNKMLTAKNAHLGRDGEEVTVSLPFTLEEVGTHHLSVSIPSQVGEALTSNNAVPLSVKVLRDKIRVLMVSGSPSLNYRFMRTALKNDPSVDLLSFVILRGPTNIMNVPQNEQSLIPFPVDTIFSKELKTFDVVIFDDFLPQPYLKTNHLEQVRDYVKEGGSFAMIGGPNLSDGTGYRGTPLAEILPLRFSAKDEYRRDTPLEMKLSQAGKTHPVTQLLDREGENVRIWQEMPSLDGINLMEPRDSGLVLLEGRDGSPSPVLAVGQFGKGRTLVLATDASWRWYMGMVAQGKSQWAYLRFVEKMVRWLTKDPSLDAVQVILPEGLGVVGEPAELRMKVREDRASSASRALVSFSVFSPDGRKIGSQIKSAGPSGEYLGSFVPDKEGTYKLRVETASGSLEETFVVGGRPQERDAVPDPERLKAIATSSGGKFVPQPDDLLRELETYSDRGQRRYTEEKRVPLWSFPSILILILTLLSIEWVLRRRWGLA